MSGPTWEISHLHASNVFNQSGHFKIHERKGESWQMAPPVWVLSCIFKWPLWLNTLTHLEEANGYSPVQVLACLFKFKTGNKNGNIYLFLPVFQFCFRVDFFTSMPRFVVQKCSSRNEFSTINAFYFFLSLVMDYFFCFRNIIV